jgi:hypothetical protein
MSTYRNSLKRCTVGHLRAQSLANAASNQTTGLWELASGARSFLAFCQVATFSGGGGATFQVYGATDANGSSPTAIGATLAFTAAGEGGIIEIPASLITAAKPYISIVCTTATGTGICGGELYKADPFVTGA